MKISADCLSISSGSKGVPPVADVVKCMAERNPFEPSNMFQEINGSNTENCLIYCKDNGTDILLVSELSRLGRNVVKLTKTKDTDNRLIISVFL